MYYEVERLLSNGNRIIVDGLASSGKSTLLSQFVNRYNMYRNADWYSTENINSPKMWRNYQLFDRNPWIDRYVYLYQTEDALDLCVEGFVTNLPDSYILLMLNDKFKMKRDGWVFSTEERTKMVTRFLTITERIWETGKIRGVIVTTPKSFRSTDFCHDEEFWELCREETLT